MITSKISNKPTKTTLLLASFVAVEGFFLSSILGSIIGRFWLSAFILNIAAIFSAYLIGDNIAKRANQTRRKKVIIATIVLTVTIVVAIAASTVALYLQKEQLHSTYN